MRQCLMLVMVAGCVGISSAVFAEPPSEDVAQLRQLKQEDPEAFHRAVQERKAQLRERLARLEQTNPDAFQRIQHQLHVRLQGRQERLERLKASDPKQFQELTTQRKAKMALRLTELKARNPERYQALMRRRETWRAQRLSQFKERHPEAFERFTANHPDWAARQQPPALPGRPPELRSGRSGARPGGDRVEGRREHRQDVRERRPPTMNRRGGQGRGGR